MSKITFTESELVNFIEDVSSPTIKSTPISESKNRRLVNWVDRFERKNKGKDPNQIFENFARDIHKLHQAGFTLNEISYSLEHNPKLIAEQSFTMSRQQGAMGTVWDSLLEGIWRWILNMFGIEGELKEILAQSLGNVPFFDIPKLMNCEYLTKVLTKSIVFEYLPRRVTASFSGMERGGTMEVLIGNSMANLADNTQFYKDVEKQISGMLCGPLGEKKKQVQDTLDDKEDDEKQKVKYGSKVEKNRGTSPQTPSAKGKDSNIMTDLISKYLGKMGGIG